MSTTKLKPLRQVKYLLSKGSPLTEEQKARLKSELHSKEVKIKSKSVKRK